MSSLFLLIVSLLTLVNSIITIGNQSLPLYLMSSTQFPNGTTNTLVESTSKNITGNYVHFLMTEPNTLKTLLPPLQQQGSIGIIVSSPPQNSFILDEKKIAGYLLLNEKLSPEMTIPVGLIDPSSFSLILSLNVTNVTITGVQENPWGEILESLGHRFFLGIMTICFCINLCLAVYALFKWYRYYGRFEFSIGVICLSFLFCANLFRIIQCQICPYFLYARIVIPQPGGVIFQTVFYPFSIGASILLSFFWLDLTSGSLYQGNCLSIMKIPAIVTIGLIWLMEIIIIILSSRNVWNSLAVLGFIAFIYAFIHLLMALFFYFASFRVLQTVDKLSPKKAKRIQIMTYKIIGSATCTVLVTTLAIISLLPITDNPKTYVGMSAFVLFMAFPQSLLQILIFQFPRKKAKGGSTTSNTSSKAKSTEEPNSLNSQQPTVSQAVVEA